MVQATGEAHALLYACGAVPLRNFTVSTSSCRMYELRTPNPQLLAGFAISGFSKVNEGFPE